jgi:hypothetical protein
LPYNLLVLLVVARRIVTEQANGLAAAEHVPSRELFPGASRPVS